MEQARIHYLLEQHMAGTLQAEEREELGEVLSSSDPSLIIADIHQWIEQYSVQAEAVNQEEIAIILKRVLSVDRLPDDIKSSPDKHRVHFLKSVWFRYAAAIILLFGMGSLLWIDYKKRADPINVTVKTVDIAPGKDGAILTLSDGSQIILDSLDEGWGTSQHGAQIMLQDKGITYAAAGDFAGEAVYNTISTPNSRQYQLTLSDGTKVWLNAGSSIQYPTAFTGNERKVIVKGEAYFEVAKNTRMPFNVQVDENMEIIVLGTHFNVQAYDNEKALQTTLLEGSIRVNGTILQPGEQAEMELNATKLTTVKSLTPTELNNVMAWKNGMINFDGVPFEAIMREIERWYDIEVKYAHSIIPNKQLAGKMTKGVTLAGLIKNLRELGVRCELSGKVLMINN